MAQALAQLTQVVDRMGEASAKVSLQVKTLIFAEGLTIAPSDYNGAENEQ